MPATRNTRQRDARAHNPLALPSFSSLPTLKSFPSFFSLRSSSTSTSASDPATLVARTDTGLTASSSATLTSPTPSRSATLTSFSSSSPPNPFDPANHKAEKLDPAAIAALTALSPYTSDRPTPHYTPADAPSGFSTETSPLFLRRPARARRADDLVQKGLDSSRLLQSISSSMDVESLQIVASSCLLLFDTVQTVRTNRTQCRQLLERVHQIVRALINLCGDAQARGRPIGDDGSASSSSPSTIGGVTLNGANGGGGGGVSPHMARAIDAFGEYVVWFFSFCPGRFSWGRDARRARERILSVRAGDEHTPPRVLALAGVVSV
ncbi:hypothetical protein C8F04DRAFT_676201 [Mycena alexandri]|uniref:Uncharacterized protein n=1 Tax=Mycena alexandri TaxID=1745969 RepID=A0AAD6SQS5_9AGAR|nr:hypothetical protein C8F04DRAFT_676201 [Mycena alexandri]